MGYQPSWLKLGNAVQRFQVRLTLREAAVFLYQSHSSVAKDCECLGIKIYPNKGGCLSQSDMWELFMFAGWRAWKKDHAGSNWRGDRKDYWLDWDTEEQLLAMISKYGVTRENFDKHFNDYLLYLRKHPSVFIQGDMKYAVA